MNIRLAFNSSVIAVRERRHFIRFALGAGVSGTLFWLCVFKLNRVNSTALRWILLIVGLISFPIALYYITRTGFMALAYTFEFLVYLIHKLKQTATSRQSSTTTTTTTTAGSAGIQMGRVRDPNPARTYFKSIPVTAREESENSINHETITIDPSPPYKCDDDSNQQASVNTPESEPNPAQSV